MNYLGGKFRLGRQIAEVISDYRKPRNFASNGVNSLRRKRAALRSVEFIPGPYQIHAGVTGALIYCDPPYEGTTGYGAAEPWDAPSFWKQCREWARSNTVLISEYAAPSDFQCVACFQTKTGLNTKDGKSTRYERVFLAPKPK